MVQRDGGTDDDANDELPRSRNAKYDGSSSTQMRWTTLEHGSRMVTAREIPQKGGEYKKMNRSFMVMKNNFVVVLSNTKNPKRDRYVQN